MLSSEPSLESPRAVIFPDPYPEHAFVFRRPHAVVSGNRDQWNIIREYLASQSVVDGPDAGIPPGGLVGGFTYEGNFYFEAFDETEVVSRDLFFPEKFQRRRNGVALDWKINMDSVAYTRVVERAQEYIAAGDIYQVNLARQWSLDAENVDSLALFRHLHGVTGAPMAALVPLNDSMICSVSPELFLHIDGSCIRTRPIKGTRPRHFDTEKDQQNAFELRTSAKEIAELIMITDLERNDLGRICRFGSVQVPELLKQESFSHVHHMVSTVEGELNRGVDAVEAVAACFPGGSITGAPKKRAMEIIEELEPVSRGVYTGALGYFGNDGSAHFNIAIRTCQVDRQRLVVFAGSGITASSEPIAEFHETNHKAAAILQGIEAYFSSRVTALVQ